MEDWLDLGISATLWLQTNYPQLEGLMQLISELGLFEFYLVVILFIFWNVDKRHGRHLSYLMLIAYALTTMFKHYLRGPRPFWLIDGDAMQETSGYGIPSGHTSMATVMYLYLAAWVNKGWAWVLAFVGIFLMGLSRVYLGQHFIHDVIGGFLLGVIVLAAYGLWLRYFDARYQELILGQRFWVAVLVPFVLGVVYVAGLWLLGAPDTSVPWSAYLPTAELESLEEMTTYLAILFGLGTGFVLESSRVRMMTTGEWWQKLVRLLIGVVVVLVLRSGLGYLIEIGVPSSAQVLLVLLPLRFLRYAFLSFFTVFYVSMFFVKSGLAEAEPEPQITGSINRLPNGQDRPRS